MFLCSDELNLHFGAELGLSLGASSRAGTKFRPTVLNI